LGIFNKNIDFSYGEKKVESDIKLYKKHEKKCEIYTKYVDKYTLNDDK